jgi:hypothetical protein
MGTWVVSRARNTRARVSGARRVILLMLRRWVLWRGAGAARCLLSRRARIRCARAVSGFVATAGEYSCHGLRRAPRLLMVQAQAQPTA